MRGTGAVTASVVAVRAVLTCLGAGRVRAWFVYVIIIIDIVLRYAIMKSPRRSPPSRRVEANALLPAP